MPRTETSCPTTSSSTREPGSTCRRSSRKATTNAGSRKRPINSTSPPSSQREGEPMTAAALAALLEDLGKGQKVALAVGGFVVGALLTGWIVKLIGLSLAPGKKVPPVPMVVARTLGGIVVAWLTMLLTFGGGW